ncbi:MAG: class I SAM-dependent methyltransferase [Anaerolineae bacterium]
MMESDSRKYFERVMEDWREGMNLSEHPYANNKSWQTRYQALQRWVADLGLNKGRVLEIGCGTGLLQDIVDDYIGIDLAASSSQFMHKPFVVCSATALPFPDNSFDGVWSFWVLEHVTEPSNMLAEMRRVTKPGGSSFVVAAYGVGNWVSQGIHKRPFHDLSLKQQLVKLTLPIRASILYKIVINLILRLGELGSYLWRKSPTKLRYTRLQPNYDEYWDYDADACVSLDAYSVALFFLSRGDRPYYPGGLGRSLLQRSQPQAYIVKK